MVLPTSRQDIPFVRRCAQQLVGFVCRLRGRESYQEFLKLLNLYSSDVISRQELVVMGQEFLSARASVDISVTFATCILSLNQVTTPLYIVHAVDVEFSISTDKPTLTR